MPEPLTFTYMNHHDILALQMSAGEILTAVEDGLRAQGNGETVIEPRVHLVPESSAHGHFNVLRGYIRPLQLAGIKVVPDFYHNFEKGLPSELAVLNLLDAQTGIMRAFLDAAEITDMRTGAITALGAKYLARPDSRILANIGARGSSYWNVRLLDSLFDFEEIRVHSRRPESRERFASRLGEDLGKQIRVMHDWRSTVQGADIVVEASRLQAPQPLLETAWIKPSACVIPYGTMSAVEFSLTDIMDKMVVDDWGQCGPGRPFGALREHVDAGKLNADNLHAELCQIVVGARPGRESDAETILFWHRGLSISDMALGHAMLEKAQRLGIGQTLIYR